jgi:uncharacterized protein (DUF2267 family)
MNFDQFTGQVQHRLELPGTGESVRAIRATLTTLGERLQEGEATDLASSLPMEVDFYLTGAVREHGQRFDWQEFLDRVREREGMPNREQGSEAAYHARVIVSIVDEVVAPAEMRQIRDQLPADEGWEQLFELIDTGE